ncbi:MAG: Lrp/AsnC family transcriptional regulator [Thiothrix sp.]|nr:MAG: Lrp/AsnC family transcriptional regulator [Thiothrix sp.]
MNGRAKPSRLSQPLDRYDQAILAILQQDNKTPQRTIAEAVNLSAPAVQRRIKRMEESGIIQANIAVLDPNKIGQSLTLFVEVEMESERTELFDAAKRSFAKAPEVQQCYYVTGEADFILIVLVSSMADYEALTRRLFFANNNVKRFRTFVAMERVKVGMALPVLPTQTNVDTETNLQKHR